MKSRRNLFLGTLVIIALSHAANGAEGIWSGTTTATWDTSDVNWSGVAGTPWDLANGPTNTATFNLASLAATVSGTVHTNGITFTTGGSLSGGVVTLAGATPAINVAPGQTGTLGTTDLAGSAGLIKTGDGILSLGSAKTLSGGVTVNAGSLLFTTGGGVGSNAINLGDTSGTTGATLAWANNSTTTSGSAVTVRSGSGGTKTLQVNSGVTATISSLALNDNVAKINDGSLTVTNNTVLAAGDRTISVNSGSISLNGPVDESATSANLIKAGGGSLILANAANTFTGTASVTGGTLQANAAGSLPDYAAPGNVTINGGTLTLRVGGSGWSTDQVDDLLASAIKTSGSLGIDTTNGNLTQWTALTPTNLGTLSLVKAGANTLTLDQANTFAGSVSFAANTGVIKVTHSGGFGTGAKTVSATVGSSARIDLDGSAGNLSFASNIQFNVSGSILRNVAGNNVINGITGAALGAGTGIVESNGGSLTLAGSVRAVNSGGRTLQIQGSSTGANTISGQIIDSVSTFSLSKQGTGTWTISNSNNTFTGATTISGGTLIAQSNTALGSTTGATTVNGGTLDLGGTLAANTLNFPAEVITIHGAGVGGNGALVNNGSNEQTNAVEKIVLGANATVGGTKRWDVRGSGNTLDMGGFTLTKKGANTVVLVGTGITNPGNIDVLEGSFGFHTTVALPGSATNTLTVRSGASADFFTNPGSKPWTMVLEDGKVTTSGGTTSNWAGPGTLAGTTGGTFDISSGQAFTFNGNIGESAAGKQFIKSGAGTVTLAGANSFTGATSVTSGTLKLDYTTNDTSKLGNLAALNLTGSTVELAAGTHTEAVGSVNLGSGASSVIRSSGTAVLQMNAIVPALGASINFGADGIASTDTPNTNGILGAWATVTAVGGTTWAVNSTNLADGPITGLTTYTLSSTAGNTASNYLNANISIDSNQTLGAAATPNSLRFNNAAANTLTLQGANSVASGGILVTSTVGNNLSTITGGTLTGPLNGDFIINQQNTANSLLIGSGIINNGTTNLLKLGAGRAILSGNNTYSGTTTISAGTLQIGDGTTDGGIANSSSIINNGALIFNTATSHSYANVISGTGSLTKEGPGTCTLSGNNSFTGAIAVSGGTLTLSGNKTGNTGTITVSNLPGVNATLNIQNGTYALGGNAFSVTNALTTPATATVNQTGGVVSFSGSGNALLLGNRDIANTAIYNLSAGSITTGSTSGSRGIILGTNANATSTFTLSGTGVLNMTAATGGTDTSMLQVGRFDADAFGTTNTFNQTGGTANVANLSVGGNGATGDTLSSTITWTGGTFVANAFPRLAGGDANTATLTIGGTADVTLPAIPSARGAGSTATVNFDGGTLKPFATSPSYLSAPTIAYIQDGGANFSVDTGKDITISQNLLTDVSSLGGGLTKSGTGTLFLTGVNTYTGDTTVTEGTLSLGNGTANSNLDNNSDVVVAGGATLNLNFSAANVDTVKTLTLNGVQKAAGVWGAPGSGAPNTDSLLSGTGYLDVQTGPVTDDYLVWAASFSPTVGATTADDDGDGLTNFQEYAFGLDPKSGSSVNPITQPLDKTTGVFKYTRRATPATTGVSYTYESSTTLSGAWDPVTPALTPTTDSGSPVEEITVTVPAGLLSSPKLFIRVMAVKP